MGVALRPSRWWLLRASIVSMFILDVCEGEVIHVSNAGDDGNDRQVGRVTPQPRIGCPVGHDLTDTSYPERA